MGPWAWRISGAEQVLGQWVISAVGDSLGVCPDCGTQSSRRHGWHERHLQDLPAQGAGVTVKLRMQLWQCRSKACERRTFAEQLPEIAAPQGHRTRRAAELVHLFGHGVGGPPGERLMKRIGMPTSDDTIVQSDTSRHPSRILDFWRFWTCARYRVKMQKRLVEMVISS